MRFLLVEDNADLAQTVLDRLKIDGHATDWAPSLGAAWDYLAVAQYDVIFLDIMLPDGDGRDFLSTFRAQKHATPVIVMTARSAVSDRVALLDTGADDYITKPFDFTELEARVRAVLRRQQGASVNLRSFLDLTYDPATATVSVSGDNRELRNRELRLFEIFIANPEYVFSKAQLMDRLFSSSDDISENAVEVYIARLRKKIEGGQTRIETIRGIGYRLTAS